MPRLDETFLDFTITLYFFFVNVKDELDEEVRVTQEGREQSRKLLFVQQKHGKSDCFVCMVTTSAFLTLRTRQRDTHYLCFFLAVKTNVDYQVIASFVTEDERVCSIKEALEVVREWNPDWSPHLFMTDNCSQEIQAIENLFPGKSGLMISQPAFKFQDATVRL